MTSSKTTRDIRYEYVVCSGCGQQLQRMDYYGPTHGLTCRVPPITTAATLPLMAELEPDPDAKAASDELEEAARLDGIEAEREGTPT